MNKHWFVSLAAAATVVGSSCNSNDREEKGSAASAVEMPQAPVDAATSAVLPDTVTGKVVETMDSGGYTYVLADIGAERIWAAAPEVAVTVGEEVTFSTAMPMVDYKSSTLDRVFDRLYFCGSFAPSDRALPDHHRSTVVEQTEVDGVEKADGGVTVGGVFSRRTELVGTEIVVRGKVVKFSSQILGKNWLHIQDGTGGEGTNDLTITTDATAAVGDTVLVRGVLLADRDFGYGYEYELIIEDARITVE